jgi:hypothetical protein
MATIRRGTIVQDIINALKLQVGNILPDQTSDKVVLTYDFLNTIYANVVSSGSSASAGALTIYTTPSNKDFYLCSIDFSFSKDATCDVATGRLGISAYTAEGGAKELIALPVITLKAEQQIITLTFPKPILLQRNTSISGSTSYTAGLMSRCGHITGFTVED